MSSFLPVCCVSECIYLCRGLSTTYRQVLDVHLLVPVTTELEQILSTLGVLDMAANSIVCSSHPPLDLEVNLGFQTQLRAANVGVVTELVFHLTEKDSSGVHVWLGNEVSLVAVQQTHDCNAFHETADRVAQESASGFEGAINADVVLGGHEEVARLGRVVRCLLRDVVTTSVVGVVPVSGKGFAEDGVQRLLDTTVCLLAADRCLELEQTHGGLMCHPLR